MNNIKANDYFNVIVQALAHILPLREFPDAGRPFAETRARPEVFRFSFARFGTRGRSNRTSHHTNCSSKSLGNHRNDFDLLNQSDPVDFLSWFFE